MSASDIQVQRAISAALRNLSTATTFSAGVRTLSAPGIVERTVTKEPLYLEQTIDLILDEFEKEDKAMKI